jgi:tetratricopeptide (TPR) repeat protein
MGRGLCVLLVDFYLLVGLSAGVAQDLKQCREKRDQLWQDGRFEEVLEQSTELLALQQKTFGKNSTEYAATLATMAHAHERVGNVSAAMDAIDMALDIQEAKVGKNHTSTAHSYMILGKIYVKEGQYAAAAEALRGAKAIIGLLKGEEDVSYWQVQTELGAAYTAMGLYDIALKIQSECLKKEIARSGEDSIETAKIRRNLGKVYYGQGEHQKSKAELEKAVKVLKTKLTGMHPDYVEALNALVSTNYHLGNFDGVIPLYKDMLDMLGDAYGQEHTAFLTAQHNLQMVNQYVASQTV